MFSVSGSKQKKQILKRTNVLFIQKTGLVCITLPDQNVNEFIFPTDVVADGDVINRESLHAALATWLESINVKAIDTLCVVAGNCLFEKIITPNPKTKAFSETELTAFTEAIPFQHITVVKKTYKDGSTKVLVANKDLLAAAAYAIEKSGLNLIGMYPEATSISTEFTTPPDSVFEMARRNIALFTQKTAEDYSFNIVGVTKTTHKSITQMSVSEAAQQPINPLVAIFAVLLLVIMGVGVGYWQYNLGRQRQLKIARARAQARLAQKAQTSPEGMVEVGAENVTPTMGMPLSASGSAQISQTSVTPSPTGSTPEVKLIRLQLVYTSETQKLYENVRQSLERAGGYQISSQLGDVSSATNRVLVSSNITSAQSSVLAGLLSGAGISTETKQAVIDDFDVVIELASYNPTAPTLTASPTP